MGKLDPHSYADLEQGKIKSLDLNVLVDFKRKSLKGEAVLNFHKGGDGVIDLDTRDLIVDAVYTRDGLPVKWEKDEKEGFMGERLRVFRPVGTKTLIIRYSTSPKSTALQWLDPQQTAGGEFPFLFSQCQPIHARSMVPLQDTPLVRFSYNARIMVPRHLCAIMSAAPGEVTKGPTGDSKTFVFRMPQPIPSYLLALAVGNISYQDLSPRARVYAEPETLAAAVYEFGEVENMVLAAEEIFGPYPWERFDFAVMPPSFPYGGMENPRLTFLTPTLLAGDRSLANVLIHELAHSWTGNLVTNATMNDFWLNEGFTVWAERRILEKLEGLESFSLSAALGRISLNEEIVRFGGDSPYTRLKGDLDGIDPDEVYSQVPYEKGFLFVQLAENIIGRQEFDAFVKRYMNRYRFSSITTETFESYFVHSFAEAAEKIGMDTWLRGTGLPENAPEFESQRLNSIRDMACSFSKDPLSDLRLLKELNPTEVQVFLSELPTKLTTQHCQRLEQDLDLKNAGNAEILCLWYCIAIDSSYTQVLGQVEAFLGKVGRMKFIKPLFQALMRHKSTVETAQKLFEKFSSGYHPIARSGIENILRG